MSEITDKPDYKEAIKRVTEESKLYSGILLLTARVKALESAIAWALGQNGDFRGRHVGEGAYWWRNELRERALMESNDKA